ncbi:hypothetical protein PENTCL1PPCAC_20407 [Pristionchus entomophagus]|uniref:Ribosomal protein n=1 Tax=Pristionchus entomophagus TaxID=358040 RepID=A0AAV5TUZ1_9BILA|nr:hypothetical protein PENTCL1PPCAC_20407 [Pristionchus entomophagus]
MGSLKNSLQMATDVSKCAACEKQTTSHKREDGEYCSCAVSVAAVQKNPGDLRREWAVREEGKYEWQTPKTSRYTNLGVVLRVAVWVLHLLLSLVYPSHDIYRDIRRDFRRNIF